MRELREVWPGDAPMAGHAAEFDDFTLANDPRKHRPRKFDDDPARQRVLIDGLDCLPGQLDLF